MSKSELSKKFLSAIAALACSFTGLQASAQDADGDSQNVDESVIEEVMVVGTRRSIQSSAELKRNSDSVIEAITIEDIGLLPDISIAESLERVLGVTANESRGQATQLIVRGLGPDLTLTTFNGRELAGEQDGREVQLGLFPSELVNRVRVLKSPLASTVEGGVAGTIDMESVMPLDRKKRIMSVNIRAIRSDMPSNDIVDNEGLRGSFTYIDQFNDGKLGIAAGLAYSKDPQLLHQYTSGEAQPAPRQQWDSSTPRGFGDIDGDGLVDFVRAVNILQPAAFENTKTGGIFNVQWRPTDTTEVVFDGMLTKRSLVGENTAFRHLLLNNTLFSNVESDAGAVGTAETLAGGSVDGALVTAFDATRARFEVNSLDRDADSEFSSFGLNINHAMGAWSVNGDIAYSDASLDLVDISTVMQISQVGFSFDASGGSVPSFTNHTASFTEPVIGSTATTWRPQTFALNTNGVEDELLSSRIDFSRELDAGMLSKLSFGVRYVDRTKRRFRDNDFQGFQTAAFSATNDQADSVANANAALTPFPFSDVLGDAGASVPADWFYIDGSRVLELRGAPNLGLNTNDVTVNTFDIDETYLSAYVQLDFLGVLGDSLPFRGNLGLRVVETETVSNVVTSTFTTTTNPDGVIDTVTIDPIDPDNINGVDFKSTYTNVLPSLNVVFSPTDTFDIRFAAAKSITRPNFQLLGNAFTLTGTTDPNEPTDDVEINGRSGNPFLDAFSAWGYDLSFEWYPTDDINLTVGYFLKDVDGFIINSVSERPLIDQNGVPVNIIVDQPVNEDKTSRISGIEIGYSQAFTALPAPFDGLGMSVNYFYLDTDIETPFLDTYLDGNGTTPNGAGCLEPDPTATGRICSAFTQGPNNFAKNAFNGIVYYSKGAVNVRLAARYKDDYARQGDNFNLPRYQKSQTFYDFSFAYKVSRKLRLLATVNNITNEPNVVYWQDPWGSDSDIATQRYTDTGRKFVVGARYNF